MIVQELRNDLEQQKGQQKQILQDIKNTKGALKQSSHHRQCHERAQTIIREVGLKTQQQLQFHISEITSLALSAVFDEPYELVAEFVERRSKTECDLYFARNNSKVDPLSASGGGVIDVAAFALRVASWSMEKPSTRPVLILDEPFKSLKGRDANRRVLEMIKQISKELGLQIIMVSDERIPREEIIEMTDRVFDVSIHKRVSKVEAIE